MRYWQVGRSLNDANASSGAEEVYPPSWLMDVRPCTERDRAELRTSDTRDLKVREVATRSI